MPRLSMWRPNHSNDFKFLDRIINEQFTVGGTGINVHLYLGPATQTDSVDETVPEYTNTSAQNIQDLLFLENRDRSYRPDIFNIRGIYQVANNDFDLSQFGIQLSTDTIYVTFHINNMVQMLGRKLMIGDVLEMEHLKDYFPLDENNEVPAALRKYYVVKDANRDADGFSQTWWPHLWRVKCEPMVDSQEYKDILNQIKVDEGIDGTTGNVTLGSVSSIINKYQEVNDAILREAETNVPYSGYDVSHLYVLPVAPSQTNLGDPLGLTGDDGNVTADSGNITSSVAVLSPDADISGWLTGDGKAPNGLPVYSGIAFPLGPKVGDYALRTDYLPNRLFRWNGARWVKIEDNVRTTLTPGPENTTLRSGFVNNTDTYRNNTGNVTVRQSLSKALKPKADN